MLHLAIIGIVCAVSAPNEGTTFIGQKNYEFNTFCLSNEGKRTVAKVIFPRVYNVDVHNSSDCAKQIAKRTSTSFYDYIIKQYQSSRNNSCRIMENISLEKEKNFRSNVDFAFRRRNLLWKEEKSALRPSTENEKRKWKKRYCKFKAKKKTSKKSTTDKNKSDLNHEEKRLLLSLKNLKTQNPGHFYFFKMNDLDLNKGIQKLCKKMDLENQEREKTTRTENLKTNKKMLSENFTKSLSILNNLKKVLSLGKDSSKYKNYNVDSNSALFSVKNVRGKNSVAEKTAYISNYDIPKIIYKTSQNSELGKNPQTLYSNTVDSGLTYRRNLIAKPYPYSSNFKANFNFLYPSNQKFVPKSKKKRHYKVRSTSNRHQKEVKNWPIFKKLFHHRSESSTVKEKQHKGNTSTEKPTTNEAASSSANPENSQNTVSEKPSKSSTNCTSTKKIESTEESNVWTTNEDINLSLLTTSAEIKDAITENMSILTSTEKQEKDFLPDHTIEKPFLEAVSKNEGCKNQMEGPNFKTLEPGCSSNSFYPLLSPIHRQLHLQHLLELSHGGILTPSRYLKIRHTLRAYLARKKSQKPSKGNFLMRRRKRCGGKNCSAPRKCWRSAPLLCIPYIKKGQEDVLRYLVKVIEKMMGKPFPPKSDIFGKTKYKPAKEKAPQNSCDDSCDYDSVNESTYENTEHSEGATELTTQCTNENSFGVKAQQSSTESTGSTAQVRSSSHSSTQELHSTTSTSSKTSSATVKYSPSFVPSTLLINTPPATNSWFPTVTIFVPRLEETISQNIEKISQVPSKCPDQFFRFTPPFSTIPVPVGSPCPSTSFVSTEKTATPMFLNPVLSNSSIASYPCSTIAPVLGATESITLATSRGASFVSTMNSCKLYISNSPVGQEEYYSLSPHSYKVLPEYSRMKPYQCSEVITLRPVLTLNQEPTISSFNQKRSQAIGYANGKILQNVQETLQWPSATKPIPLSRTEETFQDQDQYQSQAEEMQNNFKMPEESFPEYPFEFNNFRKNERNHKYELSKHFSKRKGFHYDDYFSNENHIPNQNVYFGIPKRKPFKMKHPKRTYKPNLNLPPPERDPFFDYYSNERYPIPILDEMNKINFEKLPRRMRKMQFRRDFYRKMKKTENQDSLTRQKREDDYILPEIYSDYLDDPNYKDESRKKYPELENPKTSDEKPPDPSWTPPSYDMLCELAKMMTESNTTELESDETTTFKIISTNTTTSRRTDSKKFSRKSENLIATPKFDLQATLQHQTTTQQNLTTIFLFQKMLAQILTTTSMNLIETENHTWTQHTSITTPQNQETALHSQTTPPYILMTTHQNLASPQILTASQHLTKIQNPTTTPQNRTTMHHIQTTSPQNLMTNLRAKPRNLTTTLQIERTPRIPITTCLIQTISTEIDFAEKCSEFSTLPVDDISRTSIPPIVCTTQSNNLTSHSLGADALSLTKKTGINSSISISMGKSKYTDYIKTGKASFFQANSRTNLSDLESNTVTSKNFRKDLGKEEKEWKRTQDLENEDGQVPTTLKTANIVKGPKKLFTKPSPKVYSKVYPDFLDFDFEINDTIATTAVATSKAYIENKTVLLSSTLKPDIRLQLLAVCEGYLEIIKRIKAQNQTFGEDLDAELARYCESIISQSFNNQLEKPKKAELCESTLQNTTLCPMEENENNLKSTSEVDMFSAQQKAYENVKKFPETQVLEKIPDDKTNDSVYEKETDEKKINDELRKKKKLKDINEERDSTEIDSTENSKSTKKEERKKKQNILAKNLLKEGIDQKNNETEEGILKKGITEEQVKLIHLLKKRKRALMSWLLSSKDQYKTDDLPETEYFDDEDFVPPDSDFLEYSGTIKPKRNDKNSGTTKETLYFVNETVFPVYAKHYGYDKGGELREVEVLWRKINEKTHEEEIFKNLSLIAFLMTSTNNPNKNFEEIKFLGSKSYENEDLPENEPKNENKIDSETATVNDKTSVLPKTEKSQVTIQHNSTVKSVTTSNKTSARKSHKKNATHTYISKPDPSSIVGAPPNKTKIHQNTTRKVSHKYGVAKNLFQEYSIEFLNYAVYILPAMFTILFLFCCFGCALYILKTRKSFKKYRKKKKKPFSFDEYSETTEESEDSRQQRKREAKRKKKLNDDAEDYDLEKQKKKKFWNVLKMPSKPYTEPSEENNQSEKKNFLRFLKGKRDESKTDEDNKFSKNYPNSGKERAYESDQTLSIDKKDAHKADDNSEAVERRELISLLEELKKIELEQTGEKKEVKSVHVQYMTQEDENPVHQRPEFSYPYEKNVFGLPKGYFFCSEKFPYQQMNSSMVKDYELYEDVSEMTELLPCECNYYAKKNDCLRHCDFKLNQEGRCKRFFKIFRDSGVNHNKPFTDQNFREHDGENRNFIFNKYRNIDTGTGKALMGVTYKNAGTEVKLTGSASPFALSCKKNCALVEDMESLKRQLSKKKYVRLKDDGVLCRL